jgi:predicted Zn finger-like uncharacterized protein
LKIRCEKCSTTYHLEDKEVEPFGAKVRCSICGYIFWAEPPSFSLAEDPSLKLSISNQEVSLPFQEEREMSVMPNPPTRKIFWTLGIIAGFLLVSLVFSAGRFFYVQHQHPNWQKSDIWSKVFFLPVDLEGNQRLSLINVKRYYKENKKSGTLLIIEGEIKNGYPSLREKVKIRASLMMAGRKKVMSRDVYAGWTLTSEELENLSMEEIDNLLSTRQERFTENARILPGKTLPFMIVLPPLPTTSTPGSVEVVIVGSQKVQPFSASRPIHSG